VLTRDFRVKAALLAGGCELGPGLLAHEEPAPEYGLQRFDAHTYRRLRDAEAVRSGEEVAALHHFRERAGKDDIHGRPKQPRSHQLP
jgi:hypothetical protein